MAGILGNLADKGLMENLTSRAGRAAATSGGMGASVAVDLAARKVVQANLERDLIAHSPQASRALGQRLTRAEIDQLVFPTVVRKPLDPVMPRTPAELRKIHTQLAHNMGLEADALKTLSPAERQSYRHLKSMAADRPDGQLGLQHLLIDGKLTIGSAHNPHRNLLTALKDLSHRELTPAIDRKTFLAQLHQELADPASISQRHKGTCAATSSGQIFWTIRQPADYVDFLADLASPAGRAKLPNGEWVKRKPDWRSGNDRGPSRDLSPGHTRNNGRSISGQLTEPVFMQVGYGKKMLYSNSFDHGVAPKNTALKVADGGLYQEQSARLLESIFPGEKFTVVYGHADHLRMSYAATPKKDWAGDRTWMDKGAMLDTLASASADAPIVASLNYEMGGVHVIDVIGSHHVDGVRWIDYINPWGQVETQHEAGFKEVLLGMVTNGYVPGVKV